MNQNPHAHLIRSRCLGSGPAGPAVSTARASRDSDWPPCGPVRLPPSHFRGLSPRPSAARPCGCPGPRPAGSCPTPPARCCGPAGRAAIPQAGRLGVPGISTSRTSPRPAVEPRARRVQLGSALLGLRPQPRPARPRPRQ